MKRWPDGCIDLVYLDPPFNSKANYNQLFGTENGVPAQVLAFEDTWKWNATATKRVSLIKSALGHAAHKAVVGLEIMLKESGMLAYLSYMAERLAEIKRLIKPTGSIYLHCDPTASHYLKTLMDQIFGAQHFRNEIIWKRKQERHNLAKLHLGKAHDVIFHYSKSENTVWNRPFAPYDESYIEKHYRYSDEKGKYATFPCTNEAGGNRTYTFKGIARAWRFEKKRMEQMDREGLLVQTSPSSPFRYKKYLTDADGVPLDDIWADIEAVRGQEATGFPTQKPLALLKRIINASSNRGDLVLDPFCGCGTTIHAAKDLERRWIGIDISPLAIHHIRNRLLKAGHKGDIPVHGIPTDLQGARELLKRDPFAFEAWMITSIKGMVPNKLRSNDKGIDGRGATLPQHDLENRSRLILAQVKGGGYNASSLRDFLHVMERDKALAGIFVTLTRTKARNAFAEAAKAGTFQIGATEYPCLQFWSAEELLQRKPPVLPPMADPRTGKEIQEDLFT